MSDSGAATCVTSGAADSAAFEAGPKATAAEVAVLEVISFT